MPYTLGFESIMFKKGLQFWIGGVGFNHMKARNKNRKRPKLFFQWALEFPSATLFTAVLAVVSWTAFFAGYFTTKNEPPFQLIMIKFPDYFFPMLLTLAIIGLTSTIITIWWLIVKAICWLIIHYA